MKKTPSNPNKKLASKPANKLLARNSAKNSKKSTETVKNSAEKVENPPEIEENLQETAEIAHDICSISALARRFKLDRATVRDRIEKAAIEAIEERSKEKLYLLDERLESVLSLNEMDAAKLKKTEAEAELKEIEVKRKQGEYGSVAEFTEITQQLYSRLHKRCVVQLPGKIASKLHNANSSAEVAAILKHEYAKEFDQLRGDFMKYLGIE
jgi:hypothetical protein